MDRKRLGDKIRELRKSLGLNQGDMEPRAGVSGRSMSDIENGKGNPGIGTIEDLENLFKVPLIQLAEETCTRPSDKELQELVTAPETARHLTINQVLTRFLNEEPSVRAAALSVIYGDPLLNRLSASTGKSNSR